MNDKDLKKLFTAHKVDIPDEGFSERVIRHLPERESRLPQFVMCFFITIGVLATLLILGVDFIIEQINSLISSIALLQIPSLAAIITYLSILAFTGIIGYAVSRVSIG